MIDHRVGEVRLPLGVLDHVQTFSGVAGMSICGDAVAAVRARPMTPFITAGHEPIVPASPAPLMPKALVFDGTFRVSKWKDGTAVGARHACSRGTRR